MLPPSTTHGRARRRRLPARRREDLDLERRHCRLLRGLRANRRSARRKRTVGVPRPGRRAGADGRRTARVDGPASAGPAALRQRPHAGRSADRRAPATASGSPWPCSTCSARRSERRRSALPVGRSTKRWRVPRSAALFGAPLAELQMVQGHLADMALDIDAAALLVYRAAWTKDQGAARVTREAAMAKLYATERAQRSSTRRCSSMAATASAPARSSSGCTGRSGPCASTKALPTCSGS